MFIARVTRHDEHEQPTHPHRGHLMTTIPKTIAAHEPLAAARTLMHDNEARHLPVSRNGKLVGLVSERDLRTPWPRAGGTREQMLVEDVMTEKPYAVSPTTPVNRVPRTMAAKKQGSAVVVDGGRILGVFTTTDALRALAHSVEGKLARLDVVTEAERRPARRPKTRRTVRETWEVGAGTVLAEGSTI
jgi:acetoin utilization protein AcuB